LGQPKDIEKRSFDELYTMSLKSQLVAVRILAIENLNTDVNFDELKNQLIELKK
jgi:glutaminyl-tRNA synthetase